jgi:hypothetical protein
VEVLRVRDHRLLSRDYGLSVNKKEGRVKIVRWKSSIEEILSYIDNELVIYTRNTYWYNITLQYMIDYSISFIIRHFFLEAFIQRFLISFDSSVLVPRCRECESKRKPYRPRVVIQHARCAADFKSQRRC